MSGCGNCAKIRAHMPAAIRARIEQVEARMRARRKPSIAITYTTTTTAGRRAASPQHLPAIPQGGDGAEGCGGDAILDRGVS